MARIPIIDNDQSLAETCARVLSTGRHDTLCVHPAAPQ